MKKNINLLPIKYKNYLKLKYSVFKIVASLATIFFIMILLVNILNKTIYDYEEKIQNLNSLIKDEKFIKSEKIFCDLQEIKSKINEANKLLIFLNKNNNTKLFTTIESMIKEINIIEIDNDRIENKINLVFKTENNKDIYKFIEKLNESKVFNNIYLTKINNERNYNKVFIELDYKGGKYNDKNNIK